MVQISVNTLTFPSLVPSSCLPPPTSELSHLRVEEALEFTASGELRLGEGLGYGLRARRTDIQVSGVQGDARSVPHTVRGSLGPPPEPRKDRLIIASVPPWCHTSEAIP